jgi:hypothetical protein
MDSNRKFKSSIQTLKFVTIVIIVIGVKGIGDNKYEKRLMIINGKSEIDQDVLAFGNNFRT